MGLGKLLSFIRGTRNSAKLSDVKLDPGGGPNVTAEHFSAPGDDSYPLAGDYVVNVSIQRSGGSAVVGYLDPKNDQKAATGEKRIYARKADGSSVVELWLKNDGTAVLENANGKITLAANGGITLDGPNITINASSKFTVNSPVSEFSDAVNVLGLFSAANYSGLSGGSMTTNVNLETTQDVVANGISLNSHVHGGVQAGGSNTAGPQ